MCENLKFFHFKNTNKDDFKDSAARLGKFIQKSWSKLWPTQNDYLDDIRYKCDQCSEDPLTVTDLVNTVSLGTNLTHTEVEKRATG